MRKYTRWALLTLLAFTVVVVALQVTLTSITSEGRVRSAATLERKVEEVLAALPLPPGGSQVASDIEAPASGDKRSVVARWERVFALLIERFGHAPGLVRRMQIVTHATFLPYAGRILNL